ncbi:MAG: CoA transferase [Pseudomonadales bacterium]|nr:CoA transferase [Pseudomonadales bacterium]
MAAAVEGIRILDLTTGPAGGIATMMLADFGAEVLLVQQPGDDPLLQLPAARMWQRGKHTCQLDLATATGRQTLSELMAAADVLVCNWRPSALVGKGLDYATLHAQHPHLICCYISGFGSKGPRANYPGYEHLVAACTGRMQLFAGLVERQGPVFSALQVGIHACAQSAASGILAALFERGDDGQGRRVETSIMQGLLTYEQGAMISTQLPDLFAGPLPGSAPGKKGLPAPSLYYHPAQAKDGRWMQFGNLLPHLFDNFLLVTDLIDVLADPDYNPAQMLLPKEKHEAFRQRMLSRIQTRNAADWMKDFIADGGVVATAHQTTQEALQDPDIVANGHVIKRADGGVQLGPVARLTSTPAAPGGDAQPATDILPRWQNSPRAIPTRASNNDLPLKGVRVIELATIIAAPLGASFLADMGAEVIKVEQLGGDPYRSLGAGIGSARVNAGKRSISVDLKSAAGRKVVLNLIKNSDLLIHNFRPGVPERLGIGYEDIKNINPQIIYLQCNGYGPDGPGALRPSTHPIPGAAMGGVLFQMAERVPQDLQEMPNLRAWTRKLMHANEVNPDPNTAVVVTTSAMLGLVARQRTGIGQQIYIDMFGANAYAHHDDFLSYPGKPGRALADADLLGLSATYRLYACAEEQWVFLALTQQQEYAAFEKILATANINGPSLTQIKANDTALATSLTAMFKTQNAQFWETLLAPAGIGCVQADALRPNEFWLQDPQSSAMDTAVEIQHPRWGKYRRHGRLVEFDGGGQKLQPPPLAGQHNKELLLETGLAEEEITQLSEIDVLWQEN